MNQVTNCKLYSTAEVDETSAKQADNPKKAVPDGGIEYGDYEIDVRQLEFDIENGWYDRTNNVSNNMSCIKGTHLWICYTRSQTGRDEYHYSIKGLGTFTIEAVDLDHEFMAEQIRDEAEELPGRDGENDSDVVEEVKAHATELAEEVAEDWASSVRAILGNNAYKGRLIHSGTLAWTSHVEEAFYHETNRAINTVGIEDTEERYVHDIVRGALNAAVDKHRRRWLNPHAEYIGQFKFEVEPWKLRALELHQNGVFGGRWETARVQALRETGMQPSDIADALDVTPSTVTQRKNQADEWLDRAEWTVENLTEN